MIGEEGERSREGGTEEQWAGVQEAEVGIADTEGTG